jgi:glyoxylase-like metal-dependent hydrolase (beta-lactamase superfamily II)
MPFKLCRTSIQFEGPSKLNSISFYKSYNMATSIISELRAAVYTAAPTPFSSPVSNSRGLWSPIACTLIYSANEAVLVDTPITIKQNDELIAWIKTIAPGRKLSFIYITHGHADHFLGIPQLVKAFPGALPVATAATVGHMEKQVEESVFQSTWASRFPGEIYLPTMISKPLPPNNEFKLADRWVFQAIECGQSDTVDSTALWVPELKLVACGDIVYGQVHQMLAEANTQTKRKEWIRAIEKIEALNPMYVIPAHSQQGEIMGTWHLANTKQYLMDFGDVVATANDPKAVIAGMHELYPDRFNPAPLLLSAIKAFE